MALDSSGTNNAGFFLRLREENQRLQARLDAMQAGVDQSSTQLAGDNDEVAKLKSAVEVATLEKTALEARLNHLASETVVTDKRFQATLSQLTEQRDELAKKLKESTPAAAPAQVILYFSPPRRDQNSFPECKEQQNHGHPREDPFQGYGHKLFCARSRAGGEEINKGNR